MTLSARFAARWLARPIFNNSYTARQLWCYSARAATYRYGEREDGKQVGSTDGRSCSRREDSFPRVGSAAREARTCDDSSAIHHHRGVSVVTGVLSSLFDHHGETTSM